MNSTWERLQPHVHLHLPRLESHVHSLSGRPAQLSVHIELHMSANRASWQSQPLGAERIAPESFQGEWPPGSDRLAVGPPVLPVPQRRPHGPDVTSIWPVMLSCHRLPHTTGARSSSLHPVQGMRCSYRFTNVNSPAYLPKLRLVPLVVLQSNPTRNLRFAPSAAVTSV